MDITGSWNADFIDAQYRLWKADPNAVSSDWHFFFEGFELGAAAGPKTTVVGDEDQALRQSRVEALIYRYRDLGHLLSCLDPLAACPTDHPLLNLSAFHLTAEDLDREFFTRRFAETQRAPLRDILNVLKETYCRSIGVEYMHLQDPAERRWLQDRMEPVRNRPQFDHAIRLRILEKLYQAALFERFLNKTYLGQTRFSLEGADGMIPMLDLLFDHAAARGCREIILGMAHRGRLNVQANVLGKSYDAIFSEFESCYVADSIVGDGDVKYHNGYLAELETANGHSLRVHLVSNPSHLESVDPVVEGVVRSRQDQLGDRDRNRVMPLLIHGDAAFAGQGVVAETLNLSQLEGYRTGGTIHIVINNQIGYTTLPEDARSTRYATDMAKMLMVPIFHVHGENPNALVHVARLAIDYRLNFGKDVVIDVVCYRRYGHNEGDEPYFTQPQMYERIRQRPALYQIYAEDLIQEGVVPKDHLQTIEADVNGALDDAYKTLQDNACTLSIFGFYENWHAYHGIYSHEPTETGMERERLIALARKLNTVPPGFSLHPKLERLLKKRLEAVEQGSGIDWANAESLAFASLLTKGEPLRLSGQDSRRGTFSQRHCSLVDTQTGERFTPLNSLDENQAPFYVYDSMLSEAGVLGFEYGYSLAQPQGLVMWEAQFGDFANNAQAVIDLYIVSGESKWQRLSGLVLLLPHGFEGLGPEHSSARLERFLQLCAKDNIQVCNATTPAQYFHLLRRQVKRAVRKPLVVMTPKSLLRHPLAVSNIEELTAGFFHEVLHDPITLQGPRRVLFCSGKIFYQLFQRRQDLEVTDTAIVRLEQFYPFPEEQIKEVIGRYERVQEWCWVQEEPENMAGWNFVRPRLEALIERPLTYIGREASPSPATGFSNIYKGEQDAIAEQAIFALEMKEKRRAAQ